MQAAYQELKLLDDTAGRRFELPFGESTAFIEYEQSHKLLALLHTQVPPELEGRGVGSAIVEKVLQTIAERHLKVIPLCPFVVAYLKWHPAWQGLIAPEYLPTILG